MTSTDASRSSPARLFINYRRDDTAGYAGRLYDALTDRFGSEHVLMDVDAIRPGENFASVLSRTVVMRSVPSVRQAIELRDRYWRRDVDHLIRALSQVRPSRGRRRR